MLENQFREDLEDDDFFFFRIPKKLGTGAKNSPVRIMLTSKALMANCKYLHLGCFQMDGTYRLTKTNYPWVVCGVTDLRDTFHPIVLKWLKRQNDAP